jgi:predicted DNA-binding ribbon-helix-helix protein
MCKVFAEQDPQGYRQINRSVRIAGHSTSIQLEATFWKLLDEIAESQNMTTPRFISTLYDEALQAQGEIPNFASMLRTTCALYLRGVQAASPELAPTNSAVLVGEHAA